MPDFDITALSSFNPAKMQAEGHNSSPNIAESATVPVATQFQSAHGVNTGNLLVKIPATRHPTQNSNVNTGGAAFVGNANFTGGGHTFGNNSTQAVNNTQDYSKRTIHDNSNNKGIIGDGSNNTVNSGDNSGNQTHHNYGGNKQYNQTIGNVNIYGGTHALENLKEFVSFAALHDSAEQDPD
ncbi:hypothetical protein M378DRAFT_17931, partial [Amanita muscaria Koide BX008]